MNPYTELISNHELFKLFDKLKGIDGITDAEIVQMKGLVLNIAEKVGPKMDNIKLTFKQYTDHSIIHLTNIATLIFKFLPQPKKGKQVLGLNALELTMLWTGILLHDVGMFVSEQEKQDTIKGEAYRRFKLRSKDRVEAADKARKDGNELRARAIEDAMIAEYFRRVHAQRSNAFIQQHFQKEFIFREVEYAREAAELAESHNWPVFRKGGGISKEKTVADLDKEHLISDVTVNLQYLACCLRMADILDFDRSRTPLVVFEQMDFTEPISEVEWNKHRSIKGWNVTPRKLQLKAECEKPAYFVAVQEFLGWVDAELDDFHRIVEDFSDAEQQRYPVLLPRTVNRDNIRMADPKHLSGAFKYQLEFGEIMKLLMDRSLYPDPALFLRELLQNSLDACRYQVALAREAKMDDKYIPRIDVWDHSEDETDPRVVFQDNGVGMSLDIIQNYFLRVGKSFYRSPQFSTERELLAEKGIFLDSCSRFGIGFLSCFLAGDNIEVETYRDGYEPLKISITGPSKYFLIEKLDHRASGIRFLSPEGRLSDGPPNYPGTKVTIHLKQDWRQSIRSSTQGFVLDTLQLYAAVPDFEVKVYRQDKESILAGDKAFNERHSLERIFSDFKSPHLGMDLEKVRHVLPAISAISIPLPKNNQEMSFQGGIWVVLFDNGTEYGSPEKGWLSISPSFSGFETFDTDLIGPGLFDTLPDFPTLFFGKPNRDLHLSLVQHCIDLLEKIGGALNPKEFTDFAQRLKQVDNLKGVQLVEMMHASMAYESSNRFCEGFTQSDIEEGWDSLSAEEQEIALLSLQNNKCPSNSEDSKAVTLSPSYLEAIYNRDLTALLDHFGTLPSNSWPLTSVPTPDYQLAIHGIRLPSGILDWQPEVGKAEKYHFLPKGVFANIDLKGLAVPETTASRLFIVPEKAESLILRVGIAVLDWAYKTHLLHEGDRGWRSLFRNYLRYYLDLAPKVITSLPNVLKNEVVFTFRAKESQTKSFKIVEILEQFGNNMPLAMRSIETKKIVHEGFVDHRIFEEAPMTTAKDGSKYRDLTQWVEKYLSDFRFPR